MKLSDKEREVIAAMRNSERAFKAIHQYAIKFEGDQQAMTPASLSEEYQRSYDQPDV